MDGQEEGFFQTRIEVKEVDEHGYVVLVGNMSSLSQGHLYGDYDEHVCET